MRLFPDVVAMGIPAFLTVLNVLMGAYVKRTVERQDKLVTALHALERGMDLVIKALILGLIASFGYLAWLRVTGAKDGTVLLISLALLLSGTLQSSVVEDVLHGFYETGDEVRRRALKYLTGWLIILVLVPLPILATYDLLLRFAPELHKKMFAFQTPVNWLMYAAYALVFLLYFSSAAGLLLLSRPAVLRLSSENLERVKEYFLEKGVISTLSLEREDSHLGLLFPVKSGRVVERLGELLGLKDYRTVRERSPLSLSGANVVGFSPSILTRYIERSCGGLDLRCGLEKLLELVDENFVTSITTLKILMSSILLLQRLRTD